MTTTVDVVIVGAGILGAATARELSRAGLSVAVLEAGRVNGQGSGLTAGNVHVQGIHTRRPGQDIPVDVRRLLPLQRAAFEGWTRWATEIGASIGYVNSGGWMVAETADEVADLHLKQSWEAGAGIPSEVVDGDTVRRSDPQIGPTIAAATWCDWDGFADPSMATHALLDDAIAAGAAVVEHARVVDLIGLDAGWQVRTGSGAYHCGHVVDVAGPWLADVCALAGRTLDLRPTAIQMFATVPVEPVLRSLVQHVAQGMSVKQTGDGRLMVGGGWPAGPLRSDGSADVDPAGVTGSMAQAGRVIPALVGRRIDRSWAGPLAATPDEMPVVGEVPGCAGLIVAGGTYSFTFAPVWSSTVLALVTGAEPPVTIDDLGPDRLLTADAGAAASRTTGEQRS